MHCATERQARQVWAALAERMETVGLRLHPDKTKLVYCKDSRRRGSFGHTSFTFLGYSFGPRKATYPDGKAFNSFLPAVSPSAVKEMGKVVRRWRINRHTEDSLNELANRINPIVAGRMQYYGRFYRSQLFVLLRRINTYLMRWTRKKYRRLRTWKTFKAWWTGILA